MLRPSMENLEVSPLDILHIRLVVSLVHHVAKRCMLAILGRKLAPWETSREN